MKVYSGLSWSEDEFIIKAAILGVNNVIKRLIENSAQNYKDTGYRMGRLEELNTIYKFLGFIMYNNYRLCSDLLVIDDEEKCYLISWVGQDHASVRIINPPAGVRTIYRRMDLILSIKLNV